MMDIKKIPPIGKRIVKSAVAVGICYIISLFRGDKGLVFYSQLAALWCIQVYVSDTKRNAIQRFIGTIIGALYGLIFVLIFSNYNDIVRAIVVSIMIIFVLYTTVIVNKKQASYFSCVVFLSIVVNHIGDVNPYVFVWNRFFDTVIGIVVGYAVNVFSLPKEKHTEILFVSGLDDTLLQHNSMSSFSKIELNRMIDEGLKFTVSTIRTPASMIDALRDIHMNLPVIAMDGAVLFDIRTKRYIHTIPIDNSIAVKIASIIDEMGLKCFINVNVDDTLIIFYDDLEDESQIKLVERLRDSLYRNYIKSVKFSDEPVLYFMLLYREEQLREVVKKLEDNGLLEHIRFTIYASDEYKGYSYLKIYNKDATRENMLKYLMEKEGIEKVVTFGSIPGHYSKVIKSEDSNGVVHQIRNMFEPVKGLGFNKL